jgi:hypothetical protein
LIWLAAVTDKAAMQTEPTKADPPTRKRRWFQFSLRTLMIGVTVLALPLGYVGWLAKDERSRLAHREESRTLVEIQVLEYAFKRYKAEHGEYPPSDFSHLDDPNSPQYIALANHFKRRFPRADIPTEIAAVRTLGVRTPAHAICFWLGGFATDAARPVSGLLVSSSPNREPPSYLLDPDRLRMLNAGDQVPVFMPIGGQAAPYIYLSASSYATQDPFNADQWQQAGKGTARPYLSDEAPGQFMKPTSCQIICAGADGDGDYGGGSGSFPSGAGYQPGDYDNLTNFSS